MRTAAFFSIAIIALVGGCNHPRATPQDASSASDEVSQVSPALIGKQITIRGKFVVEGKIGPYVALDDQQEVYLFSMKSYAGEERYTEMEHKLVTATGILKFYHEPPAKPTKLHVQHLPDFFYFEAEAAQLRLTGR